MGGRLIWVRRLHTQGAATVPKRMHTAVTPWSWGWAHWLGYLRITVLCFHTSHASVQRDGSHWGGCRMILRRLLSQTTASMKTFLIMRNSNKVLSSTLTHSILHHSTHMRFQVDYFQEECSPGPRKIPTSHLPPMPTHKVDQHNI